MRVLYSGYGFTEGPCVAPDGLVWVSVSTGRVYLEGDVLSEPGGGPNGAAVGPDGHVYVTQNGGVDFTRWHLPVDTPYRPVPPAVLRIGDGGEVTAVAGPAGLQAPNDLVFVGQNLYFTDSGARKVFDAGLNVISSDIEYPNGIAAGPGGLWVADTARRCVVRLDDSATVAMPGRGGPDGIRFDDEGHLYAACTTDMAVHVFNAGRHVGSFVAPGHGLVTNCCLRPPDLIVTNSLAGEILAFDLSERQ